MEQETLSEPMGRGLNSREHIQVNRRVKEEEPMSRWLWHSIVRQSQWLSSRARRVDVDGVLDVSPIVNGSVTGSRSLRYSTLPSASNVQTFSSANEHSDQ